MDNIYSKIQNYIWNIMFDYKLSEAVSPFMDPIETIGNNIEKAGSVIKRNDISYLRWIIIIRFVISRSLALLANKSYYHYYIIYRITPIYCILCKTANSLWQTHQFRYESINSYELIIPSSTLDNPN